MIAYYLFVLPRESSSFALILPNASKGGGEGWGEPGYVFFVGCPDIRGDVIWGDWRWFVAAILVVLFSIAEVEWTGWGWRRGTEVLLLLFAEVLAVNVSWSGNRYSWCSPDFVDAVFPMDDFLRITVTGGLRVEFVVVVVVVVFVWGMILGRVLHSFAKKGLYIHTPLAQSDWRAYFKR